MELQKLSIDYCGARNIKGTSGAGNALSRVVGDTSLDFLEAAGTDADFRS
jgi:hypothetical protein